MSGKIQASEFLSGLSARVAQDFEANRTILSYAEWFDVMLARPAQNLRCAPQYVKDVFDHYGIEVRDLPQGKVERFRLFDAPWASGNGRVAGQEQVQHEIYRLISNFVRDGRVSRLILLHGPNGSAKSTLVHCVQAGMEHYSRTPDGALYTYAWIFPSEKIAKGRLGFSDQGEKGRRSEESYAHLPADQIDALLPCELSDHPIFLVPRAERVKLVEQIRTSGLLPPNFTVSRYILEGDLSPRDRAIYDALLQAYEGRHEDVLRHIQVQRFYVSAKYGPAVGTVEPQDAVDAHAEQITADRSLANLPRPLQNVNLFRLWGPLIAANRGLLEYADILKRPLEWLKYLLATSEEATAALPQFKVYLDEILIASTNETYLEAFKKNPDWNSFKGRIELVPVPYLRRFSDEVAIYRAQVTPAKIAKPLAPHVVEVAALWAVLTRLMKPDKNRYPTSVKSLIDRLTPIDKLRLYDSGEVPSWCTAQEAKELKRTVEMMLEETRSSVEYEGHVGASAREIRTLILNAAGNPRYGSLTPLPVLDELRDLIRDPSVYDFLRLKPQDGFHEHEEFLRVVRDWWLDILDGEVRSSMGLVEETRYEELFARYVLHVSHSLKKERLFDKITGKFANPDEDMMREVEASILAAGENRDDFRRAIIGQIGAWGLENAGKTPDYRRIFTQYVEKMEADFYRERRKLIAKNIVSALKLLGDGESELGEEDREVARHTVRTLETRYHYPQACSAECLSYLLRERYAKDAP
ncbi:MAG: serine protein kinase PrkA [Deltaproteobacteria bacterium]|nr:serine protein kinase PrkA [Deltaproteobacteria bacterium]